MTAEARQAIFTSICSLFFGLVPKAAQLGAEQNQGWVPLCKRITSGSFATRLLCWLSRQPCSKPTQRKLLAEPLGLYTHATTALTQKQVQSGAQPLC